jgi:ribokinase
MRVSPNAAPSIVVIGSLNRDLVVTTPSLPLPGETVHGTSYTQHNGGKGANQAVALARLGQSVSMVGCVGDDEDGTALVSALVSDGVDVASISRSASRTGVAIITVDDRGENSIVVVAGANGDLDDARIEAAEPTIAAADIVLAQLEIPSSSVQRAFELATGTVVLNPAPGSTLSNEILGPVDYLMPNRTELATLASVEVPHDEAKLIEAVKTLEFQGTVIVTLGSQGAIAIADGILVARTTPPIVDVVDTVGAGDAFCAGFCDALSRSLSLPDAIAWATACGALATTKSGAQPSMPTAAAVGALLGSRPRP